MASPFSILLFLLVGLTCLHFSRSELADLRTLTNQGIGVPRGRCPNGFHLCPSSNRECPFQNATFCQELAPCIQEIRNGATSFPQSCQTAVNNYCPTHTDRGCQFFYCSGARTKRCSRSFQCVTDLAECASAPGPDCFLPTQVCPNGTVCEGRYFCGTNSQGAPICRDDLEAECSQEVNCPANSGRYSCYEDGFLCSQNPLECSPPSGLNFYETCQGGEHYCGNNRQQNFCRFTNQTACDYINNCKQGCAEPVPQFITRHCQNDLNDLGCCRSNPNLPFLCTSPYFRCVATGSDCANLPQNPACEKRSRPCPRESPCENQYFCGDSEQTSFCRSNLTDPCTQGDCRGTFPGPMGLCTGQPDFAVIGPVYGQCPSDEHFCGGNCPFSNPQLCRDLGAVCGRNITAECLQAVDTYCQANPTEIGCCLAGQTRCNPGGFCRNVATNPCPTGGDAAIEDLKCNPATTSCQLECPGKYFCGLGHCRDLLDQRCPTGPCKKQFFCGYNEATGEAICSGDWRRCTPPIRVDPPVCPNGHHYCSVDCPFSDQKICESLQVCGRVDFTALPTFDSLPQGCRDAINQACVAHSNESFCCSGANPHRCNSNWKCAPSSNSAICNTPLSCELPNQACPLLAACTGSFDCGNNVCRNQYNTPCPPGSKCPGRFWCGGDVCSDSPSQCDPAQGPAYNPDCRNGGVTCGSGESCNEVFNRWLCVCDVASGNFVDAFGNCIIGTPPPNVPGGNCNPGCPQGQTCQQGFCFCANNRIFNPTTQTCDDRPTVPTSPPAFEPDTHCWASGDPHFGTVKMNGYSRYYDFHGPCDYVLLRSVPNDLEVHVRHFGCAPPIRCVGGVAFRHGNLTVEFYGDWSSSEWFANGATFSAPTTLPGGIQVTDNGYNSRVFTFSNAAQLTIGPYNVQIFLPFVFWEKTSGLCNVWSNNSTLVARDGTTYSDFTTPNIDAFGNSWEVGFGNDTILFTRPNSECPVKKRATEADIQNLLANCRNSSKYSLAVDICSPILSPKDSCSSSIDLSRYFLNCVLDVCALDEDGADIFGSVSGQLAESSCSFAVNGLGIPVATVPTEDSALLKTFSLLLVVFGLFVANL